MILSSTNIQMQRPTNNLNDSCPFGLCCASIVIKILISHETQLHDVCVLFGIGPAVRVPAASIGSIRGNLTRHDTAQPCVCVSYDNNPKPQFKFNIQIIYCAPYTTYLHTGWENSSFYKSTRFIHEIS